MKTFFASGFLYNPKKKEVLLHKRDNNTNISPDKWAFFGGSSEGEETPVQTFIREMYEELSIRVSDTEAIPLREYLNVERDTYRYIFYVVSDKRKEEMVLGEGADFDWIPLDKVFEYDVTDKTRNDLEYFMKTL